MSRFAGALKSLGVEKGDRVAICMPMIPGLPIAMLACARIGAVHSVVFSGFSAGALATRVKDAEAKVVATADGGCRGVVPLKQNVDEALAETPSVRSVVVVRRAGSDVDMREGRDFWWDDLVKGAEARCGAEPLESEHPLFVLYTSGTTGKPRGVVHDTGGYLTWLWATVKRVFDVKPEDIYWCTADAGWIMGHSYVVYGSLLHGVTTVVYGGAHLARLPPRLAETRPTRHRQEKHRELPDAGGSSLGSGQARKLITARKTPPPRRTGSLVGWTRPISILKASCTGLSPGKAPVNPVRYGLSLT